MEFQDLIDFSTPKEGNQSDEARYSFLQGGYVEDWDSQGNDPSSCTLLFCCKCTYIYISYIFFLKNFILNNIK